MIRFDLSGHSSVYGIFPDEKWYIGKTDRAPEERWQNGKGYTTNTDLNADIGRLGWENVPKVVFTQGVADWVSSLVERYTIAEKGALYPGGYNLTTGGDKGYHMCRKTRERMSVAHKKAVAQLDPETGEILKVWGSAKEAGEALEIHACNISLALHEKQKTAGGFGWKFTDDTAAGVEPAAFLVQREGEQA